MTKTLTSPYDVADHLRTSEERAAYLEASIDETDGDAAFIGKALGDIARAKGMSQADGHAESSARVFPKPDYSPSAASPLRTDSARSSSHHQVSSQAGRCKGGCSGRPKRFQ